MSLENIPGESPIIFRIFDSIFKRANYTVSERITIICIKTLFHFCTFLISKIVVALVSGDLTSEDVCKQIVSATVEKFGRIEILVNNAGVCLIGPIDSSPVSQFDTMINTNVRSMVLLTQLCVPQLKTHRGAIVNVSSILGILPIRLFGFYSMSKAAVDMFTRSLSLELAPEGIRVNSVNPGPIPTPLFTRQGMPEEDYVSLLEGIRANSIPLGKVGTVEDVAYTVAFLASKEASFVNGALLPVEGGWLNNLA